MKVYAVSAGCYSDYSIRAVFSTEAKAKAFEAEFQSSHAYYRDDTRIEEWRIDEEVLPSPDAKRISVSLDEKGNTLKVDVADEVQWWNWRRPPNPKRYPCTAGQVIEFYGSVWARDVDHAVKMARDARAASVAAGDLDRLKAHTEEEMALEPATFEPPDGLGEDK